MSPLQKYTIFYFTCFRCLIAPGLTHQLFYLGEPARIRSRRFQASHCILFYLGEPAWIRRRRFSCVDRLIRVCVLFAPYQSSSGHTISPIVLRYFSDSSSMIYRRTIGELSKNYRTNEDSIRWQMYAKGMAIACQLLRSGESSHPPARGLSPRRDPRDPASP